MIARVLELFALWRSNLIQPTGGEDGEHHDAVAFVEQVCRTLGITSKDLHHVAKRLRER